MLSLRAFFSSIGIDSSEISLLEVAQDVLSGSTISIQAMVQAGSGSPDPTNENFKVLPIRLEGSGDYLVDRCRIYFEAPFGRELSVTNLVSELGRLFPQIFMGVGNEVNSSGLERNIATVFYRHDKTFNGEPTLQFEIDAQFLGFLPAPDIHDDWVGFVHQETKGFAVQTLKRNFIQANDAQFGQIVNSGFIITGSLPVAQVAGLLAEHINRFHFLAGRRSWIIATDVEARGPRFAASHPLSDLEQQLLDDRNIHTYVFETATINRFSSWVINLAELGFALGDFNGPTANLWTTLLRNFTDFNGFSVVTPNSESNLRPIFGNTLRGVTFIQESFSSESEMFAQDWVQDLLSLHPGIAQQF